MPRLIRSRLATFLIVAAILLPIGPVSVAQEATGETEITIVVFPGDSPGGSVNPTPDASEHDGAGREHSADSSGSTARRFPGTLSALIVLLPSVDLEPSLPVLAYVLVCDDRGTAAGWDVSLYQADTTALEPPAILENRTATIRRIMPADGRRSDQIDLVQSGQTLGGIQPPIRVLRAAPGGGSGVYLQQLLMLTAVPDLDEPASTLIVHLPFAP
jgi:hypothetical protein